MNSCVIAVSSWSIGFVAECLRPCHVTASEKKAGVVEDPQVLDHAGLLFDGPPGKAGLPFVQSSDKLQIISGSRRAVVRMSTPTEHSSWYALRREKSKFIRLLATESLIPDRFEGWRPKFGLLGLPVPARAFRRLWTTFETGGPRVALLKSSDFDRPSSRRRHRGDHLAIEIGFEARCQAF